MQAKKIWFLTAILYTIPLFGCAKPTPVPPPKYAPPYAEFTEALPVIPDIDLPAQINDGIWDVSDVDVRDVRANKLISFTFDDAPSKTLERILAVFASFNETHPDRSATATVFCNGRLISEQSLPLLHGAVSLGFELGNHTYSHYDVTTLSPDTLHAEIDNTDAILARVDGKPLHLFRAPYGRINDEVKARIKTPLIDWTIDTLDWKNTDAETIYSTVWDNRFSGAIVLMHDGYENTVEALKKLLPALYDDGYQVVSVSKMAKAHNCALHVGKVYIRARKS